MTFIPSVPGWRAGIAAPVFLLAGAVLAQAPDLQAPQPDGRKPRQPTSQSIQQQDVLQADRDKSRLEAERKVRQMDRRLNRTLSSVCNRC